VTESSLGRPGVSPGRTSKRRERLVARWRLSTVVVAVVALGAVGAVLAAALTLGGFGVPTDSSPQQISPSAVPYGLLNKTSPRPPAVLKTGSVYLYFIAQNGHLVPLGFDIARPVTIASKLNELFNGPGIPESGGPTGVQTEIPPGTQVLSSSISSGLATVDLSPQIENAVGESLIQAFAQIVYTITFPGTCPRHIDTKPLPPTTTTTAPYGVGGPAECVDEVAFDVNGEPQQVPIASASGAETSKPVTRADYRQLAPVA
jgi:Sporulation and spore germination